MLRNLKPRTADVFSINCGVLPCPMHKDKMCTHVILEEKEKILGCQICIKGKKNFMKVYPYGRLL